MKAQVPASAILLCLWTSCPALQGADGAAPFPSRSLYETAAESVPETEIDRLVAAKCKELGLSLPANCSDAVFVRRAYLDVIGTLPAAEEAARFIGSQAPGKRAALIDDLLQRDEFAEYWALKWGDLLRVKSEFPINLWPNAVQAYHRWIRDSLKANMPYDQFARELLTASGSNFREAPVNFYRAVQDAGPEPIAKAVALTFLGMRAENWPKERLQGMARFFEGIKFKSTGEWKEEIVYVDLFDQAALAASAPAALLPDGTQVSLPPGKDARMVFADWLTARDNPCLARALVNRVWFWLMGRGIIHEADDLRPDNPPAHPELLAYLERELVQSGFDIKQVYRLILNSRTYQRSTLTSGSAPVDSFAFYQIRRLEAEVLADAICQVTGTHEQYSSPIPEPFMFIPDNARSIELPDGSITSTFLELFGRTPRDTGLESERTNRATAAQALHLLNSSLVLKKLENGDRMHALAAPHRNPVHVITDLYLTILSRPPAEEELWECGIWLETAAQAPWRPDQGRSFGRFEPGAGLGRGPMGRGNQPPRPPVPEHYVDMAWSLINNPEFLYRH